MANARKQEKSEGKRQRVPFGGHRQKLQLSDFDQKYFKSKGLVVRWINDQNGRIEAARAGAWDFVEPDEAPSVGGGELHQENSDLHGKVSKVVSMGVEKPIRAFLMKLPLKYWKEDQAAKAEQNSRIDDALRAAEHGGQTIESGYTPR
jgi:hypothetical protein